MADIKVRVGAQNAIKVLSSASGGAALFADTATNVIGGIASVTQLDVSGISTLQSLRVSDTLRVTGISTFVGVATFNSNLYAAGNVTIGGTLQVGDTIFGTDIDTRNLKSSGITTLASNGGITTTGGDLYVGGDLYIADDVVLDEVSIRNINVTGISTLGIASAATLNVVGISTFNTVNVTGVSTLSGNVSFGSSAIFADSKKILVGDDSDLEIFHSGTDSYITNVGTGALKLAGTGNVSIENSTLGTNSAIFDTGGGIDFYWAGAGSGKRLEILGTGATVTGDLYVSGDLFTGGEGKIGEDVTTRNLDVTGISTLRGDLSVAGVATFNGVTKFDNVDVVFQGNAAGQNMTWDASENDLEFTDLARIKFGDNDDLEIWHGGGNNSHIKNSTNDLKIRSDSLILKRADDSEAYLKATVNSDVKLYYNGTEKFATTDEGVNVVGNVTAVDGTFSGNVSIAGTLTKEDVTNIDSVGIVTAGKGLRVTTGGIDVTAGISTFRQGINVAGLSYLDGNVSFVGALYNALWDKATSKLKFYDLAQLTFGDGNDLQIYSDGTNGIIKGNSSTNILGITSVTSVDYYGTDATLTGTLTAGLIDGGSY